MVIEKIQRKAEIWNIPVEKAAIEHFREYPEDYRLYVGEVTDKKKQVAEDREWVNSQVEYHIWSVASRENLNPEEPADMVKAAAIAARENVELFKRQRQVNSTRVGKTSLDPPSPKTWK